MLIAFDPYGGTVGVYLRRQVVETVAEAGCDGMNLPLRPDFFDPLDQSQVEEMAGLLRDHGLTVPSLIFGKNLVTTPGKESECQEWMEVALGVAQKFEVPVISLWPNLPKGVSQEQAFETLTANLAEMAPMAQAQGRTIGLEFEKGCPLDNYRQALDFLQSTDSQARITCDTYHLFNDHADPYQAALAMKGWISDVHLSGSHRGAPGSAGDQFDYQAFMRGLREIEYQGPFALQYHLESLDSIKQACAFARSLESE